MVIETRDIATRLGANLRRLVDPPSMEPEDVEVYAKVADYITQHVNTNTGISMFGIIGCGKTSIMTAALATMSQIIDGIHDNPVTKRISAADLNDLFGKESKPSEYRELLSKHKHLYIDDLGAEDPYNSYHQYYHASGMIQEAYPMSSRGALHISTNLSPSAFSDRYGARVLDRLKEMNVAINYMSKTSKRQKR